MTTPPTPIPSFAEQPFATLLASIAAKTPAPGGGAVASAVGALSASLGSMVVAYSVGKKSLAAYQPALEEGAAQLERARMVLIKLAIADMEAYGTLNALQKLPEGDAKRAAGWASAVAGAIAAPSAMLAASNDLLRLLERLRPITNEWLKSDLAIAAVLAEACARSAAWNVRINLPLLSENAERERVAGETDRAVGDARARAASIEAACASSGT